LSLKYLSASATVIAIAHHLALLLALSSGFFLRFFFVLFRFFFFQRTNDIPVVFLEHPFEHFVFDFSASSYKSDTFPKAVKHFVRDFDNVFHCIPPHKRKGGEASASPRLPVIHQLDRTTPFRRAAARGWNTAIPQYHSIRVRNTGFSSISPKSRTLIPPFCRPETYCSGPNFTA